MYLGRYQLGGTVPLRLHCETPTHAIVMPDHPPAAHVFDGSNTKQFAGLIPIDERYVLTGSFRYPLFLGSGYTVGHYSIVYYYVISGVMYSKADTFEVVPGGDTHGAVAAAYFYERPEANYIIQALEDGSLVKRRNPTI